MVMASFLPRDAMLAQYMLSSCVRPFVCMVCLSVRLSVTSRHCTKTAKHIGSRKQHRYSSFLTLKISSKFQWRHLLWGAK